jgi:glycosyltransferase involved in cell wall biosynthesis
MAAGTPVVAYANGGLGQYIADAGSGRVIDANPRALASAVLEVCSLSDQRWTELSNAGTRAIETTHSPETYLQGLLEVYTAACGKYG